MTLLKRHRLAKGLTQAQLGKLVKRSPGAVCQWEKGAMLPDPDVIPKLARVLGVPAMEITRMMVPENTAAQAATAN